MAGNPVVFLDGALVQPFNELKDRPLQNPAKHTEGRYNLGKRSLLKPNEYKMEAV